MLHALIEETDRFRIHRPVGPLSPEPRGIAAVGFRGLQGIVCYWFPRTSSESVSTLEHTHTEIDPSPVRSRRTISCRVRREVDEIGRLRSHSIANRTLERFLPEKFPPEIRIHQIVTSLDWSERARLKYECLIFRPSIELRSENNGEFQK